jgi:hypothetical protein
MRKIAGVMVAAVGIAGCTDCEALTLSVDSSQIFRGRHFVRELSDGLSGMQQLG